MADRTPRDRGERFKRRRLLFLREHPLCERCLAVGRTTAATELDHVKPLHLGGADSEENFSALCHQCHAAKSAGERGFQAKPVIGLDGWPVES